jgi:predicted transcriptional regulator
MTPQELREELARLGISQLELARLAGANERTVRRWCDTRSTTSLSVGAVAQITMALKARRAKRNANKAKVKHVVLEQKPTG